MERKELVDTLKRVSPALSGKDIIPVFACFCLDGENATAYDDVVALRTPLDIGVRGAVRGKLLLDFLTASRSGEVEFTQEDGQVTVKAGRAKLETPLLPESDFLFKVPKLDKATELKVNDAFLQALTKASLSMGRDPSHPWRLGVTLKGSGKRIYLYASDNKTAVRASVKATTDELVTVLPPRFCELLTEIGKGDPPVALNLSKAWVQAHFTSGLLLFSRTIQGADVEQYEKLFESVSKDATSIPVPKGLDRCLERALVILPYAKEPYTRWSVKEGKLRLTTESPSGVVKDAITIGEHPEVKVTAAPDMVHRALPHADAMAIVQDTCILLTGPDMVYVVTIIQTEE